ncbi:MAG TPA: toll/interleukin-1 receptor domain-containing protein [Sphingomicrobium sp.]|nr:toll/interleukin-1 receptor domain-containing protein [Sphingomicrobium sp.]
MAFLSYSHQDAAIADWLHETLEQFRVPPRLVGQITDQGAVPKRLTPIFRDRHELAAAHDLGEEIEEAIAGSRFLIVLCSPAAAKSQWIDEEIATFKRLHGEDRILAAILGGEPFASESPGEEEEECFPPSLRVHFDRRGRPTAQRAEPIAADLREHGDGRKQGLLKIAAGMLGVGLDELAQREATRRHRRMYWITAASVAGMLFASGLAYTAIDARDEARDERREAEGLVAFMLGDLRSKLEPIGKLDALDGVGSKVLAYYSKQDASELSDAALLQRSQALSLTAQVANSRGDTGTAQQLYRQALQGTAEALRRSPDDPQRLFDHAQNVFWIGEIARDLGQTNRAELAYREYKRLADRMVGIEPDNLKWRMEALYANENIGVLLYNQRRFAEAARQFENARRPMESLAAIDSGNAEYQKEFSTLLAWLADSHRAQGKLDRAIAVRERQASFLRQRIASGRTDVVFRQHLIPAYQALGILLNSQGQTERGIEQIRRSVAESERLLPVEPDNNLWKGLAAQARLELARTLFSLDRRGEAATEARAACSLVAQVRARDPEGSWRHLQTDCLALRSRLALKSATEAEALRLAKLALASAKSERSEDPTRQRYRTATVFRQLGDIHRRMGDSDAAKAAWTAAFAQLPRNVTERPAEMHERAEILNRLGRTEEANELRGKLDAIGFRSLN